MTLRITLLSLLILAIGGTSFSQGGQEEAEFEPYGRPVLRIYTNYHSTWTDGEANKVFEIQRAYFGYKYKLSEYISGRLTLDVGDPDFGELEMTAYLKHAYVQYSKNKFTAKLGMIGLHQFRLQ